MFHPFVLTNLDPESGKFQNKLESENGRKDHVEDIESFSVEIWLTIEFHSERDRVGDNQRKDDVLEGLRCDHPPDLVLKPLFWDVTSEGFGFQGKFDAVSLQ